MVVKVIGSVIVFLSCTAAGLFLASKDKFRADELREMKRGLILLKSEIEYSSRPLYEALIDISGRLEGAVSEIFEDSGRLLKSRKVTSASEAWERGRKGCGPCSAPWSMEIPERRSAAGSGSILWNGRTGRQRRSGTRRPLEAAGGTQQADSSGRTATDIFPTCSCASAATGWGSRGRLTGIIWRRSA